MHVTKASSDDDDFGCEYTALCPVSRFPFLSQAALDCTSTGPILADFSPLTRLVQRLSCCSNCLFCSCFLQPFYRVCYLFLCHADFLRFWLAWCSVCHQFARKWNTFQNTFDLKVFVSVNKTWAMCSYVWHTKKKTLAVCQQADLNSMEASPALHNCFSERCHLSFCTF